MFDKIGHLISMERKNNGITISQMSEFTGYSVRTIMRYENNDSIPSLEYVYIIAKMFHLSIDNLLELNK